jgi:hypothetical protein
VSGWIAVDLDGTLAEYDHWRGEDHIGLPVPAMVTRVKAWLAEGREVRIFTARIYEPWVVENGFHVARISRREAVKIIEAWCLEHLGCVLPVTNEKDFGMIELWDDRCVQVVPNLGERVVGVDGGSREMPEPVLPQQTERQTSFEPPPITQQTEA